MSKKLILAFLAIVLLLAVSPTCVMAEVALAPQSREAVLMEAESGKILFEHNATERRPIASMVKIMTLLCIYDAINDGKISLTDNVTISERSASMGGSQAFLDAGSVHKADDLIGTIVVCSANDSCVAMAEHISGSVENFVKTMNAKSASLGLTATNYTNCTGLPAVNQFSCAKDVAILTRELIRNENYFTHSKQWMYDYVHPSGRITALTNTNRLVKFYDGCDGGKTGYTAEALHCLSATAKRGDTRYIAVVVGAPDSKTRFAEVSEMLNFAFANYENEIYLKKDVDIMELPINNAQEKAIKVRASRNLCYFSEKGDTSCQIEYDLPDKLSAPITEGEVVGKASLVRNGEVVASAEIVASQSAQKLSYWDYFKKLFGIDN